MGSARPLDFGHWAAHKLESLSRNRLRHGEAVAIGIALDTLYSSGSRPVAAAGRASRSSSCSSGWASPSGTTRSSAGAGRPAVLDGLAEFREHLGGELTITLLAGVGRGVEVHDDSGRAGRAGPGRPAPPPAVPGEAGGARLAASHLLHQHPRRRDVGRGARQPRALRAGGQAARLARPAVRRRAASLREAAETLARPEVLAEFREFLDANGLYVFTINGFPYGAFHGRRVKEDVYLPDWLDDARLAYTDRLAGLLAELLPSEPGLEGSVSTVPGAFKARVTARATWRAWPGGSSGMPRRSTRSRSAPASSCRSPWSRSRSATWRRSPRPSRFFEEHLFAAGAVGTFAELTGLGRGESEAALRRHLGVCFDACHMAVEFEDAAAGLAALRAAGIRVGKIQISAGLRVPLDPGDRALVDALRPFAEGVYLHQVVERRNGGLTRFVDLPDALATLGASGPEPREWRIHFHVPLFREDLGRFTSTQDYLREVLELIRRDAHSPHLEVETYTWDVLPEEYRREDIVTAVARELEWVLARLGG